MNSQSELPFTHHLWLGDERSGFCGRTNENSYVPFIVQALVWRSIRWVRKVEYDLFLLCPMVTAVRGSLSQFLLLL